MAEDEENEPGKSGEYDGGNSGVIIGSASGGCEGDVCRSCEEEALMDGLVWRESGKVRLVDGGKKVFVGGMVRLVVGVVEMK